MNLFSPGRRLGEPVGFIGVAGSKLEILFAHPGRSQRYAVDRLRVSEVDVNEQDGLTMAFLRHSFVEVAERLIRDSAVRPFPVLRLILNGKAAESS